jgi:hypothetical protein
VSFSPDDIALEFARSEIGRGKCVTDGDLGRHVRFSILTGDTQEPVYSAHDARMAGARSLRKMKRLNEAIACLCVRARGGTARGYCPPLPTDEERGSGASTSGFTPSERDVEAALAVAMAPLPRKRFFRRRPKGSARQMSLGL